MTMNHVYRLFQWVILLMMIVIIYAVGPRLKQILFPVITKFEILPEGIQMMPDGTTQVSGILIKERGECEPIEGTLTVFTDEFVNDVNHPAKKIAVKFEPNETWSSRPVGSQYFGPWTFTAPGPPLGPSLIIRIRHRCHPFWETETVLFTGLTSDFFPELVIRGPTP